MHKFIYQIHANVISPSQNFFGAMKTDSSEYSWLVDVEVDFFVSSLPNALQTRKLCCGNIYEFYWFPNLSLFVHIHSICCRSKTLIIEETNMSVIFQRHISFCNKCYLLVQFTIGGN